MSEGLERIPLQIDVQRVIQVLAAQIYQSPLALLRENAQNAFDAVRMRLYQGDEFEPHIQVDVSPMEIQIRDNGLGMTYSQVKGNFWRAGSSSKNTAEARAAGVVGTFGIGAMANFGIASRLRVVTESAVNDERTETSADGATLSANEDCIEVVGQLPEGNPGTLIVATIPESTPIDVLSAIQYITEFVRHVSVPVFVNGDLVSQQPLDSQWPAPEAIWSESGTITLPQGLSANVAAKSAPNGQLWIDISDIHTEDKQIDGRIVLLQGGGRLQTLRSGFGLAIVGVSSVYGFGGAVDLPTLEPTAGREALSDASMTFLQDVMTGIESWVSERLGTVPHSDNNLQFVEWARRNSRHDLCGYLRLKVMPSNESITLDDVRSRTADQPMQFYAGGDNEVVRSMASEESPLLRGSQRNPRRDCEQAYIQAYCKIQRVSEGPKVLQMYDQGSRDVAELAIAHRVSDTLERDYFLRAQVSLGKISHSVPALVLKEQSQVNIILDPDGQTFSVLRQLYETEYGSFSSFCKDFVRTVVFPRVEELVPSSSREGAAAFLKRIRSKPDLFEYELADREELSAIWEDYHRGSITFVEAARRSRTATRGYVQVVRSSAHVGDVAPDLIANQEHLPEPAVDQYLPAIGRRDVETSASILTVDPNLPALNGFRCFLALSDRFNAEKGDFFLQPHRTSIVWGGQKVLFVFQHHSGQFGLYYDIQTNDHVSSGSGGNDYVTATLILGSRIFIPIPDVIQASFVPKEGKTKRFEVRGEVLHTRVDHSE